MKRGRDIEKRWREVGYQIKVAGTGGNSQHCVIFPIERHRDGFTDNWFIPIRQCFNVSKKILLSHLITYLSVDPMANFRVMVPSRECLIKKKSTKCNCQHHENPLKCMKGALSRYFSITSKKLKKLRINVTPQIMVWFCYKRLCYYTETVCCHLLLW